MTVIVTDYLYNKLDDGTCIVYGGGERDAPYIDTVVNGGLYRAGLTYRAYEKCRLNSKDATQLKGIAEGVRITEDTAKKLNLI